ALRFGRAGRLVRVSTILILVAVRIRIRILILVLVRVPVLILVLFAGAGFRHRRRRLLPCVSLVRLVDIAILIAGIEVVLVRVGIALIDAIPIDLILLGRGLR